MLINKITLSDFKNCAGVSTTTFKEINLVTGENGAGKSTLALHSLLFVLFGHSEISLTGLPTRDKKTPTTYVEVDLDYLGKNYIIKRSIPTSISIKIDGVELALANNALKQAELDKLFRGVDYFRKFRMIDIKDGINILEDGQQGLRKTLLSFNDNTALASARTALLAKKSERERLNKDKSVIYKHFPSDARFEILKVGFLNARENLSSLEHDLNDNRTELNNIFHKRNRIVSNKDNLNAQRSVILADSECPMCKQGLPVKTKQELLQNINRDLTESNDLLAKLGEDFVTQEEVVSYLKNNQTTLLASANKLQRLQSRLEARLQQKQYVWTSKDVLIVKKAIEELDSFSTFFITEKLKTLEPLINNVISKLGFKVRFEITDNGNFDIILDKAGAQYRYKDLSSGERLLVTVAFQLALLMEKGDSGLIVADEGFSSLSNKNLELIIDLFKNSTFQLIFVVHRYTTNDNTINTICLK